MRELFSKLLKEEIKNNPDVYLLLGGVGYGYYEPDNKQIISCEASEQAMVDMAVGLALSGKIPFVYSITPHLYRAFEGIRIYLDYHKIPVKLIGSGRDKDYGNLGFTHWGHDDKKVFGMFENIEVLHPELEDIENVFKKALITPKPFYINLSR